MLSITRRNAEPLLLLVLTLLAGCRSERVPFAFKPMALSRAKVHTQRSDMLVAKVPAAILKLRLDDAHFVRRSVPLLGLIKFGKQTHPQIRRPATASAQRVVKTLPIDKSRKLKASTYSRMSLRSVSVAKEKRAIPLGESNLFSDKNIVLTMIIAGIVLATTGVFLGLMLGGWLGFGLGFLLIALGFFVGFAGHFFQSYFVRH